MMILKIYSHTWYRKNTDLGTHHLQFQKLHADSITICHPINIRDYMTKNQSLAACPHLHSASLLHLRSEYIFPSSLLPFIHQDLIKLSMLRNTRQKHFCGLGRRRGRSPEAKGKNNSSGQNILATISRFLLKQSQYLVIHCSALLYHENGNRPTLSEIRDQSTSHCFGVRESSLMSASTCVPKCVCDREREREGERDRNLPSDE